jgi:preprotein translocase subunit SecG
MKEQKNDKKIVFFLIIIITILLYYGIRKNEEKIEQLQEMESKTNKDLSLDKLVKGQIEDDIHLNNSKLLNTRVDVDELKKAILKVDKEKENKNKYDENIHKSELWKIETFFLSLFCIIIGGLYYYSKENEEKKNIQLNKIKNININKDYLLTEPEMEYLINKEEFDNYNKYDDENN